MTMKDLSGKVLEERYLLDKRIGKGGQGDVYLAKDLHDKRAAWAVKILRKQTPEAAKRFKQEIMLAKECEHPNFVKLDHFDSTPEGQLYYVMEYLDGVTLRELLRFTEHRPLPWERVVGILIQICDALGSAHDKNVIHRDVKLENFMVVHNGGNIVDYVKVLDLGIAKLISPRPDQAHFVLSTKTGLWATPEYSAPEFLFQGVCTVRSDIYSLGIVAFELLTGSRPFSGETPAELARRHKEVIPDVPSNHVPRGKWPDELDAIVLKALRKDPDARFSSMRGMSLRLYNLLHEIGQTPQAEVIDLQLRTNRRQRQVITDEAEPIETEQVEENHRREKAEFAHAAGYPQSVTTTVLPFRPRRPRANRGSQPSVDDSDSEQTRKRPQPKKAKRAETKQMPPSFAAPTKRRDEGVLPAVLPQVVGLLFLSFVASTISVLLLIHAYSVSPNNTRTVHDATSQEGVPTEMVASRPPHVLQ